MPRSRRIAPADVALHIRCRGNNKQLVFHRDEDKLHYYKLLVDYKEVNKISIFHYCLMSNHVHLILWLTEHSNLSKFMKQISLSYFYYYSKLYGYTGHFWQDRFRSSVIDTDSYLLQCGKYIELNPVRAGIVDSPGKYNFSSYNYYAEGKYDPIVTPSPLYIGLDCSEVARRKKYINFFVDSRVINKKILGSRLFIGNDDFVRELQESYNIDSVKKKRGRPRKSGK